jgi:soluble lytic murein transglycosylase-like protein
MPLVLLVAIAVAAWLVFRRGPGQSATGVAASPTPEPAPPPQPSYQIAQQSSYTIDQGADFGAGSEPGLLDRIVQAVIQRESGGRQVDKNGNTLKSSAGALGLMQLMPATAAQYGVNPNDATQNVQGGSAYLSDLFQKYGNWFDALSAYNWGPGNVDRAMASGANYPPQVQSYATGILSNVQGDS